jgi:hypothetical protein
MYKYYGGKMKRIILIVLIGLINTTIFTQVKYPSRDSKEWNDLTVAQRWQAVNIPEDQLSQMSTNDLIEHCIDFDFMWDIFNHSNYGIGLNVVIENHNGLRELLNRSDAGELLLDFYNKIDLNKIKEITESADRGEFVGQIFFLELFLSYPSVLKQFQGNEKILIDSILKTYDTCLEMNEKSEKDYYCGYSVNTKILAMGRALDQLKGRETTAAALEEMDLSQLTEEQCQEILNEAREL